MPYRGEPSSATAHLNILKDPQVTAFLKGCSYVPNLESRTDEIRRRLVDVSPLVRPLHTGVILASDGSQYKSIIEARFPSVRVGFLKFANVIIDIADYRRLMHANHRFVDPMEMARIQRQSQSLAIALPGAGLTDQSGAPSASFLRRSIFEHFQSERFSAAGERLYDTLVDLIRRTGSVVIRDGKEGITFKQGKKSPATLQPLAASCFVPFEPGFIAAPDAPNDLFLCD